MSDPGSGAIPHPRRGVGWRRGAAIVGVAGSVVLAPITAAGAQTGGPSDCTYVVAGTDSTRASTPGSALPVDAAGPLDLHGGSPRDDITGHDLLLEFAGIRYTLSGSRALPGKASTNWEGHVAVDKLSKFGVGLFKLDGRAILRGRPPCLRSAYIKLTGRSPLKTAAGAAATLALLLGLLALAFAARAAILGRRAMVEELFRGAALRVRPRPTFLGVAGGLAGAAGVLLLLQEFAVVYPTTVVTIVSALLGLAVGVALPMLLLLRAARLANREYGQEQA